MIVEFPFFGAGINYFPTEISALRVFEPRYLLLIADSIKNQTIHLGSRFFIVLVVNLAKRYLDPRD